MEVYAEMPDFPVVFDVYLNAFTVCGHTLAHCFRCGGRLPEPMYENSVEPKPEHEAEATLVVRSVATLEELFNRIGPPDDLRTYDEFAVGVVDAFNRMQQRHPDVYSYEETDNWVRYARYVERWPKMVLDVYEYADGRLEPSFTGLPDGVNAIVERRPWWSRLLARWGNNRVHWSTRARRF